MLDGSEASGHQVDALALVTRVRCGFAANCAGDSDFVTHPLRARLLLLALAAALALSVVWAMAVAETRDVDGPAAAQAEAVRAAERP
jgi:hypothetical protein